MLDTWEKLYVSVIYWQNIKIWNLKRTFHLIVRYTYCPAPHIHGGFSVRCLNRSLLLWFHTPFGGGLG